MGRIPETPKSRIDEREASRGARDQEDEKKAERGQGFRER
jgi:hypothetical protein